MFERNSLLPPAVIAVFCLSLVSCRPAFHLMRVASRDVDTLRPVPSGYADDASRLNLTKVSGVWRIPADAGSAEAQLAGLLAKARREGLGVSIAGAAHTMGGHTISPGGIRVDMLPWNHMKLDEKRDILTVGAGAVWADVIPFLDARGRSVAVIQSNNSFSVGGSLSANCHGWQFGQPPIASTVDSFRLMKADGSVIRCSRRENRELFSLVLGGYGLFGIILDADLRVTANRRYRIERSLVPVARGLAEFDASAPGIGGAAMTYGRMNVTKAGYLGEMVLNRLMPDPGGPIPALGRPGSGRLRRLVFRGSEYSDYGKRLRWDAEARLEPVVGGKVFSRNQLLNEGVGVFENRSHSSTDILHEYFIPPARAADFVVAMRGIIPQHGGNLLNVTVRSVNEDRDTFLRYADGTMVSFVLLFAQELTPEGELRMEAMTRELVDASLAHNGRFYLPYRLHATRQQFHLAYPQAMAFFGKKRIYDPSGLFQNNFYLRYGLTSAADGRR